MQVKIIGFAAAGVTPLGVIVRGTPLGIASIRFCSTCVAQRGA
jgi:hypothetical protein